MQKFQFCIAVTAAVLAASAAQAQLASPGSAYNASRSSYIPYTTNGYVGLSVGRSRYALGCGSLGGCDANNTAFNLSVGGMFNPYLGVEAGYVHMGTAKAAGASVKAEGVNFSLVGRVPLAQNFAILGKLGTTYGRTHSEAPSGVTGGGKETGWGPSYALGVSWDFNNNWSAVLDWQRHRFDFAGDHSEWVRSTNLGLRYRY